MVLVRNAPEFSVRCEYDRRCGLVPGSQLRPPKAPQAKAGPLLLAFDFYNKLQQPGRARRA